MPTATAEGGAPAAPLVRVSAPMFDHVTIRVGDRTESELFYNTVLRPLGIDQTYRIGAFSEWQDFSLTAADHANRPTRRLHVAFAAPSREQVDEFWHAGTEAGYT